jgi:hypothetical protein
VAAPFRLSGGAQMQAEVVHGACNTPGVTVVATSHLQFSLLWLLQYKPNSREMAFSIIKVGSKSIGKFEF